MGSLSGVVDEDVGIGRHASYGTDHVAIQVSKPDIPSSSNASKVVSVLVQNVEFLSRSILLQKLRRHFALCRKDDAIFGKNTNRSTSVGNSFQRILDLIQTTLRGENGGLPRMLGLKKYEYDS